MVELRTAHDRIVDEVGVDTLVGAHGVIDTDRARSIIDSWRDFLAEHRDEITAIQLLGEAKARRIAFSVIKELADRISRPPRNWTPDTLWAADATEHLSKTGRVR